MDSIGLRPSRQRSNNSQATFHSRASTPGTSQASYNVHNRHNSQTSYNSAGGPNNYERKSSGGSRFGPINEDTKSDDDIERLMKMADSSKPGEDIEKHVNGIDITVKVQDAVEDDLERIGEAVESVQSAIQDGDGESIGEALSNVTKAVTQVPGDVQKIVEEDMSIGR